MFSRLSRSAAREQVWNPPAPISRTTPAQSRSEEGTCPEPSREHPPKLCFVPETKLHARPVVLLLLASMALHAHEAAVHLGFAHAEPLAPPPEHIELPEVSCERPRALGLVPRSRQL